MERAVIFRNQAGRQLFGILHVPEPGVALRGVAVNLLNPGLKSRVAPNRINVRIARTLCARGFPVLRFDPCGIGDSEGELAAGNELNMDLWGMVQRGAFLSDTLAANDVLRAEVGVDRLILVGQCGGAVTALLAAALDKNVQGAILVDLPVRLVSAKLDMADLWMEVRSPDEMIREYLRKAFNKRSWLNLVQVKSNFSVIKKLFCRKIKSSQRQYRRAADTAPGVSYRFLWPVREACEAFRAREGKLSFLFAENDFAVKEFSQDLLPALIDAGGGLPRGVGMHIIKDANHIYTEEHWQEELFSHIHQFMDECAPGGGNSLTLPQRRHER